MYVVHALQDVLKSSGYPSSRSNSVGVYRCADNPDFASHFRVALSLTFTTLGFPDSRFEKAAAFGAHLRHWGSAPLNGSDCYCFLILSSFNYFRRPETRAGTGFPARKV